MNKIKSKWFPESQGYTQSSSLGIFHVNQAFLDTRNGKDWHNELENHHAMNGYKLT